jgi:penicillin-binding protein 2
VVVENAGFGAEAAAPIARRVFDYLMNGQYPSVEDMAATRIGKSGAPIGTPRRAVDVPLPGLANATAAAEMAAAAASSPLRPPVATTSPAPGPAASAPVNVALVNTKR